MYSHFSFLPPSHAHLHTHACTFFPMRTNSLKGSLFTHSYNSSLPLSPPPLPACHFAFGQRELEWSEGVSAMHMKCSLNPDMHVSRGGLLRVPQSSLSPFEERTGWASPLPLRSHPFHILPNLLEDFLFVSRSSSFFSDQLLHFPSTSGCLHSTFCQRRAFFSFYTLGKETG